MSDQGSKIPTLTDLIEKGIEIKMSDLGLEDELQLGVTDDDDESFDTTEPEFAETDEDPLTTDGLPADDAALDPALEQTIRRILDEHMELAFQEIRRAIQKGRRKG